MLFGEYKMIKMRLQRSHNAIFWRRFYCCRYMCSARLHGLIAILCSGLNLFPQCV